MYVSFAPICTEPVQSRASEVKGTKGSFFEQLLLIGHCGCNQSKSGGIEADLHLLCAKAPSSSLSRLKMKIRIWPSATPPTMCSLCMGRETIDCMYYEILAGSDVVVFSAPLPSTEYTQCQ